LSIREVLVGPKICIIWRSTEDGPEKERLPLLSFVVVVVVLVRSNVVPQEYPNNLLKAASTTALVGDDDDDDVEVGGGGSCCGGSLRFPNKGAATAATAPSVVLWLVVILFLVLGRLFLS
jgi:hypothetical protein